MNSRYLVLTILVLAVLLSFGFTEYPKWKISEDHKLHVYFLDVGQGDATLIKTPERKIYLIDGGPTTKTSFRISEILPFRVDKIDAVFVSHFHSDHIGGLVNIFDSYKIGCFIGDFPNENVSETDKKLKEVVFYKSSIVSPFDKKGMDDCLKDKTINVTSYAVRRLDNDLNNLNAIGVKVSDLYFPVSTFSSNLERKTEKDIQKKINKDENYQSVLYKFSQGDFDILFMGDAENPIQETLSRWIDFYNEYIVEKSPDDGLDDNSFDFKSSDFDILHNQNSNFELSRNKSFGLNILRNISSDFDQSSNDINSHNVSALDGIEILKVPHQGSNDSFDSDFVIKVSPKLAIIFVGRNNRYGHPHKETIEGYSKLLIPVKRTDELGTIHIQYDGNVFEVVE